MPEQPRPGLSAWLAVGALVVAEQLELHTFYATSQYVHVTSAMVAVAKDERGLVAVLAHELGHFTARTW